MTHGGARPGAGRPLAGEKRVQMSFMVTPATRAWIIKQAQEQGVSAGKIIDACINAISERESQ